MKPVRASEYLVEHYERIVAFQEKVPRDHSKKGVMYLDGSSVEWPCYFDLGSQPVYLNILS